MTDELFQFAEKGRVIPFVGAGASMIPPTSLPSWWAMQREVITALSEEVAHDEMELRELAEFLIARMESHKLPPEYAAEINAGTVGLKYFEVLRALDTETPNSVHFALAEMAKRGSVRVILTTNFDSAIEVAFRLRELPLETRFASEHFSDLAHHVADIWAGSLPCQLIKLHGSAVAPDTIIDTLSQRKRGLSKNLVHILESLLEYGHLLFLGYSGADLEAEPNYLSLRRMRDRAVGFSWLVREGAQPLPAVSQLVKEYGERAKIYFGSLPGWLDPLMPTEGADRADAAPTKVSQSSSSMTNLAGYTRRWAHGLGSPWCALILSRLLVSAGHAAPAEALALRVFNNHPLSRSKVSVEERDDALHVVCVPVDGAPLANAKVLTAESRSPIMITGPYPPAEDPSGILFADTCGDLCTLTNRRGDRDLALDYAWRMLIAGYVGDDTNAAARGLGLVAEIRKTQGALTEADRMYGLALDVACNSTLERAHLLNGRAILRGQKAEFDAATADFRQSLDVYEGLGLEREQAAIYGNLANIEVRKGNAQLAVQQYEQAKAIFERLGDEYGRIGVLLNLAGLLRDSKAFDRALLYYHDVRLACDRMKDAHSEVMALHGLAVTYDLMKDFVRAEQAYGAALNLAEKIPDRPEQASIHNNLGRLFRDLGRSAEMRKHRQLAADLYEQIGNPAKLAETIFSEGNDFRAEGDPSAASALFRDAWERFKNLGLFPQALNALINLAEISLAQGHSEDALKYYDALSEQPAGSRATEIRLRFLVGRGNALMQLGQTDNAVASVMSAVEVALKMHGAAQAVRMALDISRQWQHDFKAPRVAMTLLRGTRRLVENEDCEQMTILDAYLRSLEGETMPDDVDDLKKRAFALYEKGELEGAIKWLSRALSLATSSGDRKKVAQLHNNIGFLYRQTKDITEAIEHLSESTKLYDSLGESEAATLPLINLGQALHEAGRSEEAIARYESIIRRFERANNLQSAALVRLDLAAIIIDTIGKGFIAVDEAQKTAHRAQEVLHPALPELEHAPPEQRERAAGILSLCERILATDERQST